MLHWRALSLAICLSVGLATSASAASRRGELRGVWLSLDDATDWTELAQYLQDNGFNAVFLQVGQGWTARYPSDVLPVRLGDANADALAVAVAAALASAQPARASYEPFAALFALKGTTLQWFLLFIILIVSLVVRRPWCHFFCPMRTCERVLLDIRQKGTSLWRSKK